MGEEFNLKLNECVPGGIVCAQALAGARPRASEGLGTNYTPWDALPQFSTFFNFETWDLIASTLCFIFCIERSKYNKFEILSWHACSFLSAPIFYCSSNPSACSLTLEHSSAVPTLLINCERRYKTLNLAKPIKNLDFLCAQRRI